MLVCSGTVGIEINRVMPEVWSKLKLNSKNDGKKVRVKPKVRYLGLMLYPIMKAIRPNVNINTKNGMTCILCAGRYVAKMS